MSPQDFTWDPDPAILADDLAEYSALASDDWRRLYLNEFTAPEPIEVSPAEYLQLATAKTYDLPARREWRTHRDERTLWYDGRPVVVVYASGSGGSDDGGSDDDGTPPALRFRPTHGGRLPPAVSVH